MNMVNFNVGAQPMAVPDAEDLEASQAFIQTHASDAALSLHKPWRLLGPMRSVGELLVYQLSFCQLLNLLVTAGHILLQNVACYALHTRYSL